MKLYYAPGTCALATHLALEFAGARYEAVRLDFSRGEQQSPEYLRINPKGRVPALVTDRGVLTETPALLEYVARTHPQAQLAPLDDAFAMAKCNEVNSYLCSTVHVAHAHKNRGTRWADDAAAIESMKKKVAANMAACFTLIEGRIMEGPWVFGGSMTICDLYLFTIARWLEGDGVDVRQFPKVAALCDRLAENDVVKRALEAQRPAARG